MIRIVTFDDLEFERVPQRFFSTAGVPQTRWARVGMPRIPAEFLNGTFYLYRTADDARAGRDPGGTGFIVLYNKPIWEEQPPGGPFFYGVTNWHVACASGLSVIRLNKKDGGTDVVEFGPEDWHFIPGRYDVAVVPLSVDIDVHQVAAVSVQSFCERASPQLGYSIGVGEDVFMIGLFVDHDGLTTNIPSARFGHISMLADARAAIKQPTGHSGESFVIDMHSRTGFSGSPVYVYRTFAHDLTNGMFGHEFVAHGLREGLGGNSIQGRLTFHGFLRLLGIHWGQFPERWELKDQSRLRESSRDLITEGRYVEGMSGMTCVIPAWDIREVLDMPSLKAKRDISGAQAPQKAQPKPEISPAAPVAESVPSTTDENPRHKEDFTRLLGAAVKTPRQDD